MTPSSRPKVVLICHGDSSLNRTGIARWLASFSDLAGIVSIEETHVHLLARVRRELKRVGVLRFLDVLAFRLYYFVFQSLGDAAWQKRTLNTLAERYPDVPDTTEVFRTPDPNSPATEAFLRQIGPDLIVARCKRLLKERVFSIPRLGTFVLHPGVCPEYRNAHGAFWALANRDLERVGLTLLKIDKGVDTGPVYGYYTYDYDEVRESHTVIMARLALDNLDPIRDRLLQIHAGTARPLETAGRRSGVWGQPWLTRYLAWKWKARQAARWRQDAGSVARIS